MLALGASRDSRETGVAVGEPHTYSTCRARELERKPLPLAALPLDLDWRLTDARTRGTQGMVQHPVQNSDSCENQSLLKPSRHTKTTPIESLPLQREANGCVQFAAVHKPLRAVQLLAHFCSLLHFNRGLLTMHTISGCTQPWSGIPDWLCMHTISWLRHEVANGETGFHWLGHSNALSPTGLLGLVGAVVRVFKHPDAGLQHACQIVA